MWHGNLQTDLNDGPEHIEIGKMDDLAVHELAQIAVKCLEGEETGDKEEERHAEGFGELRDRAKE